MNDETKPLQKMVLREVLPEWRAGRGRWWRPNSRGYAPDLAQAGLYPEGADAPPPGAVDERKYRELDPDVELGAELAALRIEERKLEKLLELSRVPAGWTLLPADVETPAGESIEAGAYVFEDAEGRIRASVEQGSGSYDRCQVFDETGAHVAGLELRDEDGYDITDPTRAAGIRWCLRTLDDLGFIAPG